MVSPTQAAQGRRRAESRLTDECRIITRTQGTVLDDNDEYTDTETVHYTGPCVLKAVNVFPNDVDAAGQDLVLQSLELGIPIDGTSAVARDQTVVMTKSQNDPAMVGLEFRIEGPAERQTYATLRRFRVEEVS
jgi:hypothetical protein